MKHIAEQLELFSVEEKKRAILHIPSRKELEQKILNFDRKINAQENLIQNLKNGIQKLVNQTQESKILIEDFRNSLEQRGIEVSEEWYGDTIDLPIAEVFSNTLNKLDYYKGFLGVYSI